MLLLFTFILTFAFPLASLADKYCDQSTEDYRCSTGENNDLQRTYSTRTTFNQSVQLFQSKGEHLTLPGNCEPVMFYMFARHGIRYPKREDIIEMGQVLPKLQEEINNSNRGKMCEQDLEAIKTWSLRMTPDNDNHITSTGVEVTRQIAKKLADQYPDLFDPTKVNFQLGVTSKIRTLETARAFVDGLKDVKLEINLDEADYVQRDFLEFHSICKKKIGQKPPEHYKIKAMSESKLLHRLRERVSQRIGLNRTISNDELDIIYKSCSFEQAIYDTAPWCAVLSTKDLQILESKDNLKTFYEKGPGQDINEKMACPVVKDLYEAIEKAIKTPESRTTYAYFSHAGALSRLWSTLDVFDKLSFHKNHCQKSKSEWLTSEILSFNANFDAVLYRCSQNPTTTNPADYRLVTMANGIPIEIDDCDKAACRANSFLRGYQKLVTRCNLDTLCRVPKKWY